MQPHRPFCCQQFMPVLFPDDFAITVFVFRTADRLRPRESKLLHRLIVCFNNGRAPTRLAATKVGTMRQVTLVASCRAQNCTSFASAWRHPQSRTLAQRLE
jgi:hypothetical protein